MCACVYACLSLCVCPFVHVCLHVCLCVEMQYMLAANITLTFLLYTTYMGSRATSGDKACTLYSTMIEHAGSSVCSHRQAK